MVANPFFGRLSDRTASPLGMRRPWMVMGLAGGSLGILTVALAPGIAPAILALGNGSYAVLFTVAGTCALCGAAAILPGTSVR
jgi:Na+/melibiose symporter-like transporter